MSIIEIIPKIRELVAKKPSFKTNNELYDYYLVLKDYHPNLKPIELPIAEPDDDESLDPTYVFNTEDKNLYVPDSDDEESDIEWASEEDSDDISSDDDEQFDEIIDLITFELNRVTALLPCTF